MKQKISEALRSASKEELIDIIEERMYQDIVFQKILFHRLLEKNEPAADKIQSFREQVQEEMSLRYPDTSVMRSACYRLKGEMENWPVADYVQACIAIIRSFDDALCNGAGMEDETDFELSMDIEDAQEKAIARVKEVDLDTAQKEKIRTLLESEMNTPLGVYDESLFSEILKASGN